MNISDRLTYLVPSKRGKAAFLSCSGLLIEDALTGLIDAAMGPEETPDFLREIRPDVCVISHYHIDHSCWGHDAETLTEARILTPAAEIDYLTDIDHFIARCGLPDPDIAREWRAWLTGVAGLRPLTRVSPIAPGDVLDFGRTRLEVIAAPGHSPGHHAYWESASRTLFCVDIGVDSFGPWYGWRDADLVEYIRSIRRLAELGAEVLVSSHGGIVTDDVAGALDGCLGVLRKREVLVARDLESGIDARLSATEGHIYGDVSRFQRPLDIMYAFWEEIMIREHVRVLAAGGVDSIG